MIPYKETLLLNKGEVKYNNNNVPKVVFWGVAPTGDIHLGYLPYIGLLKQFKKAGSKIIIFIGDYHAYLDASKTSFSELEKRSHYYTNTFLQLGIDKEDIVFAKNEYLKKEYINEFFRFSLILPSDGMLNYAERTLKNYSTSRYTFGDLLYVATQIFDVAFFDVTLILCGLDESGIYKFGIPFIESFYQKEINHVYLPLVSGVHKPEMHASDNESNKISVHESYDSILRKIEHSVLIENNLKNYILPLNGYTDIEHKNELALTLHKLFNVNEYK